MGDKDHDTTDYRPRQQKKLTVCYAVDMFSFFL